MKTGRTARLIFVLLLTCITAQGAILQWGANTLLDTGGPLDDGGEYGLHYALPGVDLYLIYNGVGASYVPLDAVAYNYGSSQLYNITAGQNLLYGTTAGTIIDSYTTTQDDYDNTGGFSKQIEVSGLGWLGDFSATWKNMNLRQFTILAVSDLDGNYVDAFPNLAGGDSHYNLYSASPVGFSNATGASSIGYIGEGVLDVTGIPEPSSAMLIAVGGIIFTL